MGAINPFLEAKIGDFASQQWYCSSYFLKTCNRLLFMGFKLSQVILGPWLICPKFYALLLRRVQHLCPHFLRLFLEKKTQQQKCRERHDLRLALRSTRPAGNESLQCIALCVLCSVGSSVLKNALHLIQSDRLSLSIIYRAIHFDQ